MTVDDLILLAASLMLAAILSSKLSVRAGVPTLILFMGVGMLAGEDGVLGLAFDDFTLAHAVGTVALVLILFDGGLRTTWASVRSAWGPALVLSTIGVVVTATVTGVFAAWILSVPLGIGILLGSIVGSTDAAAVFAVLRGQRLHVHERLAATLEVESGSNDPMAVLLTLGTIAYLLGDMEPGWPMVGYFLRQALIGGAGGVLVGWLGARLVNRVQLDAAGLYPVLTLGLGLLAYGLTATLGGSGFLATYVAGILVGNAKLVFKRGILLAHDGGAWVAQIAMFVTLGLLATPSRIAEVAAEGTLVASVLIFVARPLAVVTTLAPFRFTLRELGFLAWAGLKGAIPIILALYPLLAGVEQGLLLFDVVFFVVVLSALLQGWTLPGVATRLGVRATLPSPPPVSLEITSLSHVDGDIVDYRVDATSFASGRRVRDLALPDTAVVAMLLRGNDVIPPRGSTLLQTGDHAFVVIKPAVRPLVDRMFAPFGAGAREVDIALPISAETPAGEVEAFYGIHLSSDPTRTVGAIMTERLGDRLGVGATIDAGLLRLAVAALEDGRISRIDVQVLGDPGPERPPGDGDAT